MTGQDLPTPVSHANEISIEAGCQVFTQGQPAENFVVVTHGCITVFARSEDGKEVVLYRVEPGELCILTTACLIGHTTYPADAVTDASTRVRVIPLAEFEHAMEESEPFRRFVFASMGERLAQVTRRFEHIVLDSTARRLSAFLYSRSGDDPVIAMTHDRLATEIGTAREVVSRHLKLLEQQSLVALSRGAITVLDRAALAQRK